MATLEGADRMDLESSPLEFEKQLQYLSTHLRKVLEEVTHAPPSFVDQVENPKEHLESLKVSQALSQDEAPLTGSSLEECIRPLFNECVRTGMNHSSPGFAAFIGGGGIPQAGFGDLWSSVANRFVNVWMAAPALVTLEANVIRWMCNIVGYQAWSPKYPHAKAFGVFTSGGSMANFLAIVAARRAKLGKDGEWMSQGTIYISSETHHSILKGCMLAGFSPKRVRSIPVHDDLSIRADLLQETLLHDRKQGLKPFFICGCAGTTNTGAVDDLESLAQVAAAQDCWFHVDGCYGAPFRMTSRGGKILQGMRLADSVSLDPHKSLFIPHGVGVLVVKDRMNLKDAMFVTSSYMPATEEESALQEESQEKQKAQEGQAEEEESTAPGVAAYQGDPRIVDFHAYGPELTAQPRGLKLWFPIQLYGMDRFKAALDEKLDLAREMCHQLEEKVENLQIVARPILSTFAFRLCHAEDKGDVEKENQRNKKLLQTINAKRTIFLSPTLVRGQFVIRVCILSFRTHRSLVGKGIQSILLSIQEVS